MHTSNNTDNMVWLFQANPDNFPASHSLERYLHAFRGALSTWYVGQHKDEIKRGDLMYVWRSAGKARRDAGIIARGRIESDPKLMEPFDSERPYESHRAGPELRVRVTIEETYLEPEQILSRAQVARDSILRKISIMRAARGSNFPLLAHEKKRIDELLAQTGGGSVPLTGSAQVTKLARISFNSSGWRRPTGDAKKYEAPDTFNHINGFGYEDWLFRSEWLLDGWRYAFIQAFNQRGRKWRNKAINLTLYAIDPKRRRLGIGRIHGLEVLAQMDAKAALAAFQRNGWFDIMRKEVRKVGGNTKVLKSSQWAPNVLNVRFRAENMEIFPKKTDLGNDRWIMNRHRYKPYDFDSEEPNIPKGLRSRRGRSKWKPGGTFQRHGSGPVQVDPIHEKMQFELVKKLRREFPRSRIDVEKDFVDVAVHTKDETILFEIKSDLAPMTVIRQALGQLLEYAFHPLRAYELSVRLVIVGRNELGAVESRYLARLQEAFPLEYRAVPV
jgi:hypothetical protein